MVTLGSCPVDRLRQLMGAFDSLALFYDDLAATSEALLLSIRFGDGPSPRLPRPPRATFWRPDIARCGFLPTPGVRNKRGAPSHLPWTSRSRLGRGR